MNASDISPKITGLRKREQIARTNKKIFAWVAVAAVVATTCAVLLQFLIQQAIFNQSIINAKTTTNNTLVTNKTTAVELKKTVDALVADTNLAKVKTKAPENSTNSNLQVILDALPTTNDSATFANSLSKAILPQSQVTVSGITVGATTTKPTVATGTGTTKTPTIRQPEKLDFSVNITGDYDQIQKTLVNVERVIRPINVTKLSLQNDGNNLKVTMAGVTYYMPAATVGLGSKTLKP